MSTVGPVVVTHFPPTIMLAAVKFAWYKWQKWKTPSKYFTPSHRFVFSLLTCMLHPGTTSFYTHNSPWGECLVILKLVILTPVLYIRDVACAGDLRGKIHSKHVLGADAVQRRLVRHGMKKCMVYPLISPLTINAA